MKTLSPQELESLRERERHFIECLRGCYISAVKKDFSLVLDKSNEIGSLNKFDIKEFFSFGVNFIRQSYLYSQKVDQLYEFESLNNFSIENFAPFISRRNYKRLISLFENTMHYVDRNANTKLLATSFLLDLSRILYTNNQCFSSIKRRDELSFFSKLSKMEKKPINIPRQSGIRLDLFFSDKKETYIASRKRLFSFLILKLFFFANR